MRLGDEGRLEGYANMYGVSFKTRTGNQLRKAQQYFKGLFQSDKRNMERMCEIVKDSDYYAIQHFISESPWDHQSVMDIAAAQASKSLQSTGKKIALLVDESGHAKKGTKSVGVSRQYSGTLGKVDNCQVGVYCTLSSDQYYSIIDAALYLPKQWTDDTKRCSKAGIPADKQQYKTKLELALEMIKHQQKQGIKFDYVGGDGLYGNNYALIAALDDLDITAIFDIHNDQYIYTEPLFMKQRKCSLNYPQ